MKEKFIIVVTVTPEHLKAGKVARFIKKGATILRVNGAFLAPGSAKKAIKEIRKAAGGAAKVMLDLPGYKIRFIYLGKSLGFRKGRPVTIKAEYFNYPGFIKMVKKGSVMRINNGFNEFRVLRHNGDRLVCEPDSDGKITKGRGIHLEGVTFRPAAKSLSGFDRRMIEAVKGSGLDYVGLSFVHDEEDIEYVKSIIGRSGIECVPKLEAKESFRNLDKLMGRGGMFILDRGDMAGELGLYSIWKTQRDVLAASKKHGCRVVLATQLLHSMVENPIPTVAEIDSLCDLMRLGIAGVQLSEETSVGKYAEESIEFIGNIARKFKK